MTPRHSQLGATCSADASVGMAPSTAAVLGFHLTQVLSGCSESTQNYGHSWKDVTEASRVSWHILLSHRRLPAQPSLQQQKRSTLHFSEGRAGPETYLPSHLKWSLILKAIERRKGEGRGKGKGERKKEKEEDWEEDLAAMAGRQAERH